jgi:hypothetical protein
MHRDSIHDQAKAIVDVGIWCYCSSVYPLVPVELSREAWAPIDVGPLS